MLQQNQSEIVLHSYQNPNKTSQQENNAQDYRNNAHFELKIVLLNETTNTNLKSKKVQPKLIFSTLNNNKPYLAKRYTRFTKQTHTI